VILGGRVESEFGVQQAALVAFDVVVRYLAPTRVGWDHGGELAHQPGDHLGALALLFEAADHMCENVCRTRAPPLAPATTVPKRVVHLQLRNSPWPTQRLQSCDRLGGAYPGPPSDEGWPTQVCAERCLGCGRPGRKGRGDYLLADCQSARDPAPHDDGRTPPRRAGLHCGRWPRSCRGGRGRRGMWPSSRVSPYGPGSATLRRDDRSVRNLREVVARTSVGLSRRLCCLRGCPGCSRT